MALSTDDVESTRPVAERPDVDDGGWRKQELKARLFGTPGTASKIGRFVVLGPLGSGGMGSVLRAYDETLERQVAVKLMHRSGGEKQHRRMLREAQALAKLSHPNVVQVYEVGEVEGQLFIAMELVAGRTLQEWQAKRRPWRQCLDAYVQAGRGLAAAHAAGMVHRDFKPANCIIDGDGRVRVLDFGLARYGDPSDDDVPELASAEPMLSQSGSALQERLTVTGSILGTLAYMAPEQLSGREVDARADQFAFCVSLWEALLGVRPFDVSPMERLNKLVREEELVPVPPPRGGARVPRRLVRALERGLATDPRARWPSMDALLDALERHRRRRSAGWVGTLVLGGGLAAISVWPKAVTPVPPVASPCRDAGVTQLGGAWTPDVRARVRAAMLGTELPYAAEVWPTVESQLDGYVGALGGAYAEACAATRIRNEETKGDLELRTACLDERAAALRQTIAVLEDVDARVMEKAVALVVALPGIEGCGDLVALRRQADPERRDPPAQDRLREIRERIEQARALERAGKLREGLEALAPVVAELDALAAPRLRAEARLVEGMLLADIGEHERAVERLRRGLDDALAHGADAVAVEILSTLVYVVGVDQAKGDAGLWLGSVARALVDRDRATGRAKARVLTAVGQVLSARGEHEAAQVWLEQALELLQAAVGADHIALAEPLDSLGVALRNQGELEPAQRQYERALAIRIRWQGARHPTTAHQRINLGVVLDELGRAEEAQQQIREALDVLMKGGGEHAELVAHGRTTLGISLARQTSYAAAARELELAIEAWEAVHGPGHPRVAKARLSHAGVLQAAGDHAAAVAQLERALAILDGSERTPDVEASTKVVLEELVFSLEALGRRRDAAARRGDLTRLSSAVP